MIGFLLASIIYELPRPQAYVPNNVPGCYIVDDSNRMIDLSLLCGGKKEVPRLTCADFESREAAQAAFDAGMPGTQGMDGDRDRAVCEWK
jgi:hypothetical protein